MDEITTAEELKSAIHQLEDRRAVQEILLREQLLLLSGRLTPGKLIRSTIENVFSSPSVIENIIGLALGVGTGFLTKNIALRTSVNVAGKLGTSIFHRIFRKKKGL
jgi:hypothetical protein